MEKESNIFNSGNKDSNTETESGSEENPKKNKQLCKRETKATSSAKQIKMRDLFQERHSHKYQNHQHLTPMQRPTKENMAVKQTTVLLIIIAINRIKIVQPTNNKPTTISSEEKILRYYLTNMV